MNLSNFLENRIIDALFRGGAVNAAGTLNSAAVATGVWAATTVYAVGNVIAPPSTFTAGGGKFLQCTTGGTSGSTTTLACPAIGSTLTDGSVVWTAISAMPVPLNLYVGLFSINKGLRANSTVYSSGDVISLTATGASGGDNRQHIYSCTTGGTSAASQPAYGGVPGEVITDGTAVFTELSPTFDSNTGLPSGLVEISGSGYARVNLAPSLANWAGTQAAASTTASTGTGGTTSNNATITYGAPTSNWAVSPAAAGAFAIYDQLTGGNLLFWAPLNVPKSVASGDSSPSFSAAALTFQADN